MSDTPNHKWTHEQWVSNLNKASWGYIGDWAYPLKSNSGYAELFYHYCGDRPCSQPEQHHKLKGDECGCCGTPIPDGLKMVVMLLEKL
jgi:hypothetical protein